MGVFTDGSFETTPKVAAILEERGFSPSSEAAPDSVPSTACLPAAGRSMADCREAARQVERKLSSRHASGLRHELGE